MNSGSRLIQELARCSMSPGTASKRFVRDMASRSAEYELSERAEAYAWRIAFHYRRQLPDDLTAEAVRRKVDHQWEARGEMATTHAKCTVCGMTLHSPRDVNSPCPGPPKPKIHKRVIRASDWEEAKECPLFP